MLKRTKIGSKSQIVVPKEIQEHLGIGAGDQIDWTPGPEATVILRGFRSIPADLVTPELEARLATRERAMEEGHGIHIKNLSELRHK